MTHRILMITTGGTIAGQVAHRDGLTADPDADDGALTHGGNEFLKMIGPTLAKLEEKIGHEITIEPMELCNVDSSDVDPETWKSLAQMIYDNFDEYDSFVVTHGTNTLGYTCAALSFALANSGKPIVLTGSQVPAGLPGTDALMNLQNALRIAVWRDADNHEMHGVVAVFGSHIISGTRVKKETEFDYDAFQQFQSGSIGRIGRIIKVDSGNLDRHIGYLRTGSYQRARYQRDLILDNDFDWRIASLTEFPGMDPEVFKTLHERCDVQGFILRAFGAGDPSTRLRPAFEYLKAKQIPIVVTTQAPKGNSNFQVNEPGQWLRNNDMAIPAYDMSIEAQTAKLAWLLAQKRRHSIDYPLLCKMMTSDIRGEINVLWEVED
jgi:L-asparaginase